MAEIKLVNAHDAVYGINSYQALNGLQRFQYSYSGSEQDFEEIGNKLKVGTSVEPESSGSFEVTDTGSLAPLFARMRYDFDTQAFMAGDNEEITTNEFVITQDDFQFMYFDLVEQKKPGGTFSEATLIPNVHLTRFGISLNADGVGSATFDWQGNLMIPVYKPYQKVLSFPATFTTDTTATIPAAWGVDDTTHGLIGGRINNQILQPGDVTFAGSVATLTATATGRGLSFNDGDQIMLWAYALTPGDMIPINYPTSVKFVKPDRVNIWLVPAGTATDETNRMLRIQSYDLSGDITFDELKEIAKNEQGSTTFAFVPRMPFNFSGSINVLENTLHTWAELQGKTLNESASAGVVDPNNILDVTSWQDAKIVVEWYKYGNDAPIQVMTLDNVTITGYEGSLSVGGRKEAVWSYKTDGSFRLEGHDVI